jgi:hypothetical protein
MRLDAWGNPHISVSKQNETIQGSRAIQIPPSRYAFSPFSIILKVRFHTALSGVVHFSQFHSVAIARVDSHSSR